MGAVGVFNTKREVINIELKEGPVRIMVIRSYMLDQSPTQ